MKPRLDHIGLDVSDYERSKAFYVKALAPLGVTLLMEPVPEVGGFGSDFPLFLDREARARDRTVAYTWRSPPRIAKRLMRSTPPRSRPVERTTAGRASGRSYHPHYYGAFVLDPDGNNVEAVCHTPL